ncbi:MAG: DUF2250 domain-containing protein [Natronomonas sp.]
MVSSAKIERLRREADTIMTRMSAANAAIQEARSCDGDHWDRGRIECTLETPTGEPITVELDIECDAAENAQRRYEELKELEAELERKRAVVGKLAPMPVDPVAYLVCYHLQRVEGNYPRSIAGHLDAERSHVETLCREMETGGILERVESGTVKQRRVKAKQADEVRQHHTYYRLSREGDRLLRFLESDEGKLNVLRHLPDGKRIARRLDRGGPDYPRMTAEELGMDFEYVRHLYRALRRVGVVTVYDGSIIKGNERKLKPKDETHKKHTYYTTTTTAETLLRDLEG